MQNTGKAFSAAFFYGGENDQPFGHEDLIDEEQEEPLPGIQDEDGNEEPPQPGQQQQRWMAPSLFGNLFRNPQGDAQQPEAELVDEAARRGAQASGSMSTGDVKSASFHSREDAGKDLEAAGTFQKRSPWWVEGWRPRSYLLKGSKLLYFSKHQLDRPLGVLDFSLVAYEVHCCWGETEAANPDEGHRACDVCDTTEPEDFGTFFLKPTEYPHKVFAFRGPAEEMKVLAAKVERIIRNCHLELADVQKTAGYVQERQPVRQLQELSTSNFWRFPYVSESDFAQAADSGDLLLFRGVGRRCQLIRTVTIGKYDHVALLLRNARSNSLLILEATGTDGVSVVPWKTFVGWGWHKCYERLAFRKVYFKRTSEQMSRLQTYVNSIAGAPYSLTYDKIFKRKTSFVFDEKGCDTTPEEMRNTAGSGPDSLHPDAAPGPETFFCSELVAACLKRCGVLAGARASSTYWPSSFSQYDMEPLPLHESVHIGAEQVIMFDDQS